MEAVGIWLFSLGAALSSVGWLWLLVAAFYQRWYWGLALLVCPPSVFLFVPLRWRAAARPVALLGVGAAVTGAAFACGWYEASQLGPHLRTVDGEQHLTLTGWNRSDYRLIAKVPEVVVLQMANADVTDDTLQHVAGLKQLRELDLSSTQVTDDGLAQLAQLPALATLRLARTQVTDAGFRAHLLPLSGLRELDLRGTGVTRDTVREWRKAQPGRRAMQ